MDEIRAKYPGDHMDKLEVPNSGLVLGLGIGSIVMICTCTSLVSLPIAFYCIYLANKSKRQYELNPLMYSVGSFSRLNTGKTIAIISLVISIIYLVMGMVMLFAYGGLAYWMYYMQNNAIIAP